MSGWVPCSAQAVQSAAASAIIALLAGLVLARAPPVRFGIVELGARWVALSLFAIAAATIAMVVPRFLMTFGASAWPNALRSVVRNLEVPLVAAATLGACISLIKTTLLLHAKPGKVSVVADLAATIVLAVATAALYRLVWQFRTDLDPDVGLVSYFRDQRLRVAVLCLPLAASGWVWMSAALARQPERRRGWLTGIIAAGAAGVWGGLFVPF